MRRAAYWGRFLPRRPESQPFLDALAELEALDSDDEAARRAAMARVLDACEASPYVQLSLCVHAEDLPTAEVLRLVRRMAAECGFAGPGDAIADEPEDGEAGAQ